MGLLLPTLLQIGIMPATTQAKAANFQKAEASATIFRAKSIKDKALGSIPSDCKLKTEDANTFEHTVSCTKGEMKSVRATVARTYSLIDSSSIPPSGSNETGDRKSVV